LDNLSFEQFFGIRLFDVAGSWFPIAQALPSVMHPYRRIWPAIYKCGTGLSDRIYRNTHINRKKQKNTLNMGHNQAFRFGHFS